MGCHLKRQNYKINTLICVLPFYHPASPCLFPCRCPSKNQLSPVPLLFMLFGLKLLFNFDFVFKSNSCWSLASLGSSRAPDGRSLSTGDDSYLSQPAKDVRTGCPDTPSDGFVSHHSDDQFAPFLPKLESLPPSSHEGPFIVSEALSPFNGGKTFLACHDGTKAVT